MFSPHFNFKRPTVAAMDSATVAARRRYEELRRAAKAEAEARVAAEAEAEAAAAAAAMSVVTVSAPPTPAVESCSGGGLDIEAVFDALLDIIANGYVGCVSRNQLTEFMTANPKWLAVFGVDSAER